MFTEKPGCVAVSRITENGFDWSMRIPDEVLAEILDFRFLVTGTPVEIQANLSEIDGNVIAQGRVTGPLKSVCVRCLAESDFVLNRPFRHVFIEGKDPAVDSAEETISEADNLDCTFFDGGVIDLLTLAIDEIGLALPDNPVCSPDCRGLCPVCGADRNRISCGCEVEDSDARWAALKELKLD